MSESPERNEQRAAEDHRERERFFGAAKVVALLTVFSRVFGMLRDMAIASLGATAETGAFLLAYTVPNLFRRLFGEGALAGAFVPVLTQTTERDGIEPAGRLLVNALGLLTAFLSVITFLIQLGLLTWWLLAPAGEDRRFLLILTGIMLPFMVFICVLALLSSALNCRGHFAFPAFAPILQNVIMIATAWWIAPACFPPPQLLAAAPPAIVSTTAPTSTSTSAPTSQPVTAPATIPALGSTPAPTSTSTFAPTSLPTTAPASASAALAQADRAATRGQLFLVAISVTFSGLVQVLAALWQLKQIGLPIRPRLRPVEPGIRTMLTLMAPTVVGLGVPQITFFFERIVIRFFSATPEQPTLTVLGHTFSQPLLEGAQMHVYAANQLVQFPMGVLAISLSVAVFPLLSRYAERADWDNFRQAFNRAVRLALMEGLASGVGLLVLAEPICHVIYQRRKFTDADVGQTAGILAAYVLGMWAYCLYFLFMKAFYALKEPRRPLKVVTILAVVNLLLAAGLIWVPSLGSKAFGLATAVSMSATTLLLGVLLRRRLGRIGARQILWSAVRSLAACAVMAGVLLALRHVLAGQRAIVEVAVCVPAGAAAFLAAAFALRAPELGELFRRGKK